MPVRRTTRRAFIGALSAYGVFWSKKSFAQRNGEIPTIPVVNIEPDAQAIAAFELGMRAAGWIKDINMRFDWRYGGTDPQMNAAVATEVVNSNPTIIVVIGSPAAIAMRSATATIPTVFAVVSNPVGQGIVTNLARPGGNITGFTHFDSEMGGKWLELLHVMIPQMTRFAVVFKPSTPTGELFFHSIEDGARSLNIEITQAPVSIDSDLQAVFERFAGATNIAFLFPSDSFTYVRSRMIAAFAANYRIPAMYPARRFVDEGGLIAYGPDLYDQIYRCASYVDRILKGTNPGDLPVQQPTKYTLVINLRTAKVLELNIPPSILARADEVIE